MSIKQRKISSLIIGGFFLLISISAIIIIFNSGVKSSDELIEIKVKIRKIVPVNYYGSIGSFDLYFKDFDNVFKIAAEYIDFFKYYSLQMNLILNDELIIAVKRGQFKEVKNNKQISIFGVRSKNIIFLSINDCIKKDKFNRQYVAPIGGTIMILLSIVIYIHRRYYYRSYF